MPMIQVRNASLHIFEAGEGRPLLFVHGFPLNHTMWQGQIELFAQTHRVIAPDLRGFGLSDVTPGAVEMKDFADDLAAVLDVLGVTEPVCFCGLSMGGYIGWQFIRRHGARLGSLILCDTKASGDSAEAIDGRMKLAEAVIDKGPESAADAMIPKLISEASLRRDPKLAVRLREMIVKTDPEAIAAALRGMANRPDMTDLLRTIEVPTLVIVGQQDALTPPQEMRAMADQIPGAHFVEIADAGHMAPMERVAAVNEVIESFIG